MREILTDTFGYLMAASEECTCPICGPRKYAEKYKMTKAEIKRFCDEGCSPICDQIIEEKFKHRLNDNLTLRFKKS